MTIAITEPVFNIVRIEHDGAESTIFTNFDHEHANSMLDRLQGSYSNTPGYDITRTKTSLILDHPIPGIPADMTTAVFTIREVTDQ